MAGDLPTSASRPSSSEIVHEPQARRRIAVADHTKLGAVAPWRICETTEIQTLITDTGATEKVLEPFRKVGIEVVRA